MSAGREAEMAMQLPVGVCVGVGSRRASASSSVGDVAVWRGRADLGSARAHARDSRRGSPGWKS
jgi:hypothetical protein